MIYVYALTDAPGPSVSSLRGLGGTPLVSISHGPVSAICSVHADLDVATDTVSLWQHEQVTSVLMARCTVAPVRFCTVLADVVQLREMLALQGPRLPRLLSRLRGKVELALRASVTPAPDQTTKELAPLGVGTSPSTAGQDRDSEHSQPDPSKRGNGRAYLRGLQSGSTVPGVSDLAPPLRELHAALAGLATDATVRSGVDGSMVGAYLANSDETRPFRDVVADARRRHPDLRVSLTGPWAAFSFVADGMFADA